MLETPPRAWGRRGSTPPAPIAARNTPTCVGKTLLTYCRNRAPEKHPHVRGEDTTRVKTAVSKMETPPRAWGRPPLLPGFGQHRGNTPTCVGKTCKVYSLYILYRKHPHVRGEDFTMFSKGVVL